MRTVISVIGKDSVGIIAKVSAICSAHNVNIVDITQSVMQSDIFAMVMLTDVSKANDFNHFVDTLKDLGKELCLDIRVMHEDVFNSMHRI